MKLITYYGDKKYKRLSLYITFLLIVYPIISVYSSGISSLTVADVMLLAVFPFSMSFRKVKIHKGFFIYFCCCVTLITLQVFLGVSYSSIYFFRALRYLTYIVTLFLFIPEYFNPLIGEKILVFSCRIVSIIAVIQFFVANIFHVYISGIVPRFYQGEIKTLYTAGITRVSGLTRVSSVFSEPAHLAAYLCLPLLVLLFQEEKKRLDIILVVSSLLLSISSTGYLMLALIFFLFLLSEKRRVIKRNEFIKYLGFFLVLMFLLFAFFRTDLFQFFYNRTFTDRSATTGRIKAYEYLFHESIPLSEIFFGRGFIINDEYMPSYAILYFRFGLCGIISFLAVILAIMKNNKDITIRFLVIVVSVLGVGTMCLVSNMLIYYMSFIICHKVEKRMGG